VAPVRRPGVVDVVDPRRSAGTAPRERHRAAGTIGEYGEGKPRAALRASAARCRLWCQWSAQSWWRFISLAAQVDPFDWMPSVGEI
jgi:hypothetical protein